MTEDYKSCVRNITEEHGQQFFGHYGWALSKALVHPDTTGSRQIDYWISTYQPMACVELHTHKVQEQACHVLVGEGLMEINGKCNVDSKHDVIFLPPGTALSIQNSELCDLTFIVVTTPVLDEWGEKVA